MAILLYRVDGRMLHGQVCTTYGRMWRIDEYLVINEEIAKNELQISLLEMAAMGARVHVLSPKDAYEFLANDKCKGSNTIVVFKELMDAVEVIVDYGLKVEALQIGTMFNNKDGTRKKYDISLFANDEDAKQFRKLADKGVALTYQAVPDSKEKQLSSMVQY